MWFVLTLPFLLQAIVIMLDEGVYHVKRGLPKWERIGHPIDTLSVLLCMLFVVFMPYSGTSFKIYIGLSILSCLMVTKDEFVHKHHCKASENWLHALLFILHPITLFAAGLIWVSTTGGNPPVWSHFFLDNKEALTMFLKVQASMMCLFMLYQIIFWGIIWKDKPVLKM